MARSRTPEGRPSPSYFASMDFFTNRSKELQASMANPESLPKRITTPAGQRLSVIVEDKHMSTHSRWTKSTAALPRQPMDSVSEGDSVGDEKLNQLRALREKKQIAKRGGWKRLALVIVLFICVIVAVVVGIVFGLRERNKNNHHDSSGNTGNTSPTSSAPPTATDASGRPVDFPAGSYSMSTYLDTVQANCTENAATWTCPPYQTYNENPGQQPTTFNWVITKDGDSYKISQNGNNPFALFDLDGQTLTLVDEGQDSERYTFRMTMNKSNMPSADITGQNIASTCYFNGTTVTGTLYTKMERDYPSSNAQASAYLPWPYKVRVEQTIAGGDNVPACYRNDNQQQITDGLSAQGASTMCSCLYRNWLTPDPN
ncbi:hypothetical protein EJ05DRAFT_475949 [Pseudovirgaria hyperparasitica]|uniref:Uncharacterized protein n=1 Tax=Pseudovirgaria hyperparasitica TaxID=470096 RepID=A0A6A6W710_9PEZI|nr:uncharacterized protein EJ05DRAFT_475949 [Pseudovirgaria hyperparasitica]KAF2758642.1 hypothetical protein EJ05DRAFT_475949 [Pseudovirgaria hyperparasitica]